MRDGWETRLDGHGCAGGRESQGRGGLEVSGRGCALEGSAGGRGGGGFAAGRGRGSGVAVRGAALGRCATLPSRPWRSAVHACVYLTNIQHGAHHTDGALGAVCFSSYSSQVYHCERILRNIHTKASNRPTAFSTNYPDVAVLRYHWGVSFCVWLTCSARLGSARPDPARLGSASWAIRQCYVAIERGGHGVYNEWWGSLERTERI